jgi:hypothetical protein
MSIFADDRKIIKFKCPHCGAKSGHPCITRTGKRYTGGFHMLRKGKVFPDMVKPGRGKPLPKYHDD